MEECVGREGGREAGRERERERKSTHAGDRVRDKVFWLLLLYVFFLHLGLPYANGA